MHNCTKLWQEGTMSMQPVLFLGLALLLSPACLARQLQQDKCPISSSKRALDFHGVASGCGVGKDTCSSCLCAIYDAFVPAFQAANLTYDPKTPNKRPKAQADQVIRACAPDYLLQATTAGVKIDSLVSLQQCPGDANPPCLKPVFEKLTPQAKAVAAKQPVPEPSGAMKAINGVQSAVSGVVGAGQRVVDAGQKVAASGRTAVDAVGSAARSIGDIFRG